MSFQEIMFGNFLNLPGSDFSMSYSFDPPFLDSELWELIVFITTSSFQVYSWVLRPNNYFCFVEFFLVVLRQRKTSSIESWTRNFMLGNYSMRRPRFSGSWIYSLDSQGSIFYLFFMNNNPEEVGTLGHLLVTVWSFSSKRRCHHQERKVPWFVDVTDNFWTHSWNQEQFYDHVHDYQSISPFITLDANRLSILLCSMGGWAIKMMETEDGRDRCNRR